MGWNFFFIQILEIFLGTEYRNNKVYPVECAKTIKREDCWMKTLGTICPHVINEKTRKYGSEARLGKLLLSIPKANQRSTRYKEINNHSKNTPITDFLRNIHNTIQSDIKDSFYKIRVILNKLKINILK